MAPGPCSAHSTAELLPRAWESGWEQNMPTKEQLKLQVLYYLYIYICMMYAEGFVVKSCEFSCNLGKSCEFSCNLNVSPSGLAEAVPQPHAMTQHLAMPQLPLPHGHHRPSRTRKPPGEAAWKQLRYLSSDWHRL